MTERDPMQSEDQRAAAMQVVAAMQASENATRAVELFERRRKLLRQLKRKGSLESVAGLLGMAAVLIVPRLMWDRALPPDLVNLLAGMAGALTFTTAMLLYTCHRLNAAAELLLLAAKPDEVPKD